MIEVEKSVTITNDGSVWTLTAVEARQLRDKLNGFLGDTYTPMPSAHGFAGPGNPYWGGPGGNVTKPWTGRSVNPEANGG